MQQEILFHKYRILKLLGRGGTAKVYLAEHIKLNSYRAIKYISKIHPLYELQRKEAQILKNLKHSCIPIIYDIEEDEDGSYIVEQYIEGDTLKDYVTQKGTLSEDIIVNYALQICDLINYLHSIERPILYLDLKPENIIVAGSSVKLIDFGSAIYIDELQQTKNYYGTIGYAAPELYRSNRIDERCDIYSIGMLLYFMITGFLPNHLSGIDNIDHIKLCSRQLQNIINRCLKFNPSQRYASINDLSRHLSALKRKSKSHQLSKNSIRFAIAGSQPRMGVTHFSLRLCGYFIQQKYRCIYIEKNRSQCIWSIRERYNGETNEDGGVNLFDIPMLPNEQKESELTGYQIIVRDYGSLSEENLEEFLQADIKILILGAKDWELSCSEQVLKMVAEYKDINYFFNYLDGRQFHEAVKYMEQRNCYRIPYEPNPFAKPTNRNGMELFQELCRAMSVNRSTKRRKDWRTREKQVDTAR